MDFGILPRWFPDIMGVIIDGRVVAVMRRVQNGSFSSHLMGIIGFWHGGLRRMIPGHQMHLIPSTMLAEALR